MEITVPTWAGFSPPADRPGYQVMSFRLLLAIYVVVPMALMVVFADLWLGHGWLQSLIPRNPRTLAFSSLFYIDYPHIIGGLLTFMDKEYINAYKFRLWKAVGVCLILFSGPAMISLGLLVFTFASFTAYHGVMQQVGITKIAIGRNPPEFKLWKWLSLASGLLISILVYADPHWLTHHAGKWNLHQWGSLGLVAIFLPYAWASYRLSSKNLKPVAAQFVWYNYGLTVTAALLFFLKYPFFAIALPHIIHDLTGSWFYFVHDCNRNATSFRNAFFRLFSHVQVPLYIMSPLVAILISTWFVRSTVTSVWFYYALVLVSYFHFYTDGFVWKRNAPHREAVPFGQ